MLLIYINSVGPRDARDDFARSNCVPRPLFLVPSRPRG